MPPKAEKKPTTAGKAPAGKAPAEKKEAGKKTAAAAGDKKKRSKTRKETYSSYIYKGDFLPYVSRCGLEVLFGVCEWGWGFSKGRITCFVWVGRDIDFGG